MNQKSQSPLQTADRAAPHAAQAAAGAAAGAAVEQALAALRAGRGVLVVDDPDREDEADLVFAAQSLTAPQMALLIRECSGIVCLCLPPDKVAALGLPLMAEPNTSRHGTAFTVSVEAAEGVTTGVSAADRVATVRAAIDPQARPGDLARPGHVFPLCARAGGVLERPGHTEATVDLMRLAGLEPYGVLCELTNEDGSMARGREVQAFAERHGLPVVAVAQLVAHRSRLEKAAA